MAARQITARVVESSRRNGRYGGGNENESENDSGEVVEEESGSSEGDSSEDSGSGEDSGDEDEEDEEYEEHSSANSNSEGENLRWLQLQTMGCARILGNLRGLFSGHCRCQITRPRRCCFHALGCCRRALLR